jgi:hypothetical protein
MKLLTITLLLTATNAYAATHPTAPLNDSKDMISCYGANPNSGGPSMLRIYQSPDGYEYILTTCRDNTTPCEPQRRFGALERVMGDGQAGTDFLSKLYRSESAGLIHLFGEYFFSGGGLGATFGDRECTHSKGEFKDIVARGTTRGSLGLGTCDNPEGILYPQIAKGRASDSASIQCAPLKARRLGDYEVFQQCLDNEQTLVARAVYRCE